MNISKKMRLRIAVANRVNPYTNIIPYELGLSFPIVHYTGFYPEADEILLYAAPASTFKDHEQITGYTGKTAGVSVRVAHGVTVKSGQTGSRAVRKTVRHSCTGDLLITSRRILFTGKDDSFEFPVHKISTVKQLDENSFVIQSGNSSRNVCLDAALFVYAYALTNYTISQNARGVDVAALVREKQHALTKEQLLLCEQIRVECSQMHCSKPKNRTGCLWTIVKILWILLLLILAGGTAALIALNHFTSFSDPATYTLHEILTLPNHPTIYDSCESVMDFYDGIHDVKVVSISQHSQSERNLQKMTDDKTLLYFINGSTDKEHIGSIQINLYDESVSTDMTLDAAVELLVSYLPDNFFSCYSKDSSYQYATGSCHVYVYSCRLNDTGIAYRNEGHPQYSYYYSFRILHFFDTNQWKLQTDFSAYGDRSQRLCRLTRSVPLSRPD